MVFGEPRNRGDCHLVMYQPHSRIGAIFLFNEISASSLGPLQYVVHVLGPSTVRIRYSVVGQHILREAHPHGTMIQQSTWLWAEHEGKWVFQKPSAWALVFFVRSKEHS